MVTASERVCAHSSFICVGRMEPMEVGGAHLDLAAREGETVNESVGAQ